MRYSQENTHVRIRRISNGRWNWLCTDRTCPQGDDHAQWITAIGDALAHLEDAFDRHHRLDDRAHDLGDRGWWAAECVCGYEREEKSESGAEDAIDDHVLRLANEWKGRGTDDLSACRCPCRTTHPDTPRICTGEEDRGTGSFCEPCFTASRPTTAQAA